MSFQSIDSDEFALFSAGTCSPQAESPGPLRSSVEYVVNTETPAQRTSKTSSVHDGSIYTDLLGADVPKEGSSKVEGSDGLLGSLGWTVDDFISASTTVTASGNQQPVQTYQSVAQVVSRHSVTVSWGTLESRSPQNATYTLGDDDNGLLQQNQRQFSDAYDRVSFDQPKLLNRQEVPDKISRDQQGISQMASFSRSEHSNPVGLQNINNPCYEAAISEHFKRKKHSKLSQYVSKMKNSKPHSEKSHVYDKHQRGSPVQSPTQSKQPNDLDHESPVITSQMLANEPVSSDSHVTKTTFATFTMPSIPSPLSPFSTGSHSPSQADGQRSPKALKDQDLKKYRYNQTALALQQSGLMKTTIKTAELLRKSRLLQQELTKLRRETVVFVHSVLNNPENKHLKDMYISQQNDKSITQ